MMSGRREAIYHSQVCETCEIWFATQEGANVKLHVCLGILIKEIFPKTGFDPSELLKEPQGNGCTYETIKISRSIANKIKDNLQEFNYFTDFNLATQGCCCKINYWK